MSPGAAPRPAQRPDVGADGRVAPCAKDLSRRVRAGEERERVKGRERERERERKDGPTQSQSGCGKEVASSAEALRRAISVLLLPLEPRSSRPSHRCAPAMIVKMTLRLSLALCKPSGARAREAEPEERRRGRRKEGPVSKLRKERPVRTRPSATP